MQLVSEFCDDFLHKNVCPSIFTGENINQFVVRIVCDYVTILSSPLQGFQVLVEREWLNFGHKFGDRCGHKPTMTTPTRGVLFSCSGWTVFINSSSSTQQHLSSIKHSW